MSDQSAFRNRLISLLAAEDFDRLRPHLQPTTLNRGDVLSRPNEPVEKIHFLEHGIGSIIAISADGQECEAGLFGWEAFTPTMAVLGTDRSPLKIIVQVAGNGHWIDAQVFSNIVGQQPQLKRLLLLFTQTLNLQTSYTALSNAVHPIDERLARWILMCHDRSSSDEFALTHEFLALMLAVRRPSVTTALHVLEGNRFIASERGYITVRNRSALQEFAADAYGQAEAEYLRLLGRMT
jgi:CRP-like cAMP-binding protein